METFQCIGYGFVHGGGVVSGTTITLLYDYFCFGDQGLGLGNQITVSFDFGSTEGQVRQAAKDAIIDDMLNSHGKIIGVNDILVL